MFFCGCTSNNQDKKIEKLTARVDSLEKDPWGLSKDPHPKNRTYKFDWFELGKEGHQIINQIFLIVQDTGYIQPVSFLFSFR
jgi:hypothetical protein